MILNQAFQRRVKAMVNDPVFDKPIQNKDYSEKGTIKLITKIKTNGSNKMVLQAI
ncbi:hypothetical protein JE943_000959 [Flavobacterium psychrophilum]|uniref:hypothetical protein n=1 Tax=Flavobacterium psychrophilum TaxID=96345 RepID=UPI000B7C259A|nr:hypothetical protein [Flavobacterium psychrophilum]EKT4500977.1 hypothetical protein [Flavobacterium psychrophilum]SNA84090.1 hypothetical protein FI070_440017 [Flavobacterium psychrophilum]